MASLRLLSSLRVSPRLMSRCAKFHTIRMDKPGVFYTGSPPWMPSETFVHKLNDNRINKGKNYINYLSRSSFLIYSAKPEATGLMKGISEMMMKYGFRATSIHKPTLTSVIQNTPYKPIEDFIPTRGFMFYRHDELKAKESHLVTLASVIKRMNIQNLFSPLIAKSENVFYSTRDLSWIINRLDQIPISSFQDLVVKSFGKEDDHGFTFALGDQKLKYKLLLENLRE